MATAKLDCSQSLEIVERAFEMKNRGGLACSPIFERFYLSSTKIVVVVVVFLIVCFLQNVFEKNVFSACHIVH